MAKYNLSTLDKTRRKKYGLSKMLYVLTIIILIISIVLLALSLTVQSLTEVMLPTGGALFFVAAILFIIAGNIRYNATSRIKRALLESTLMEIYGKDMVYHNKKHLEALDDLLDLDLIKTPDRVRCEDVYLASYNNINFSSAFVSLADRKMKKDSKGNTRSRYVDYFNGRIMVFELKSFNTNMTIINKASKFKTLPDFKDIQTEISLINENYYIACANPKTVFSCLTPAFLKELIKFDETLKGSLSYIFYENKLYLIQEYIENPFDFNIDEKLNKQALKKLNDLLKLPIKVIDALKLE